MHAYFQKVKTSQIFTVVEKDMCVGSMSMGCLKLSILDESLEALFLGLFFLKSQIFNRFLGKIRGKLKKKLKALSLKLRIL